MKKKEKSIMFTMEEALIRHILGPSPSNIRELSAAIEIMRNMLFVDKVPQNEILMMTHVYGNIANQFKKNQGAISRQVSRQARLCWDAMDKNLKLKYIGRNFQDVQTPRDILFYFAYYIHFQKPYYALTASKITR